MPRTTVLHYFCRIIGFEALDSVDFTVAGSGAGTELEHTSRPAGPARNVSSDFTELHNGLGIKEVDVTTTSDIGTSRHGA